MSWALGISNINFNRGNAETARIFFQITSKHVQLIYLQTVVVMRKCTEGESWAPNHAGSP